MVRYNSYFQYTILIEKLHAPFIIFFLVFISLSTVQAEPNITGELSVTGELLTEMKIRNATSFETLLPAWEKKYGSKALQPLVQIALNRQNEDPYRFIAL